MTSRGLRAAGLTLVEILVALTVVAVALLGLAALQVRALGHQRDAFDRRAAADLAAQLAERMRANHAGLLDSSYSQPPNPLGAADDEPAVQSCSAPCGTADIARRDLQQWQRDLRRRVPGAAALVEWSPAEPLMARIHVAVPAPLAAAADPACLVFGARTAAVPETYRCHSLAVYP